MTNMINFANTSHVTRFGIFYSQLHNPEVANTRFQYESCDLYWPDDVSMTQDRSILSGFQPMRASVTLQKRINSNILLIDTSEEKAGVPKTKLGTQTYTDGAQSHLPSKGFNRFDFLTYP